MNSSMKRGRMCRPACLAASPSPGSQKGRSLIQTAPMSKPARGNWTPRAGSCLPVASVNEGTHSKMTEADLDRSYSALRSSLAIVGPDNSELFLTMLCLALMARYERADDVLSLVANVEAQCAA